MTQRKTQFVEHEFRAALAREIADLLAGRTTQNRTLQWLYEVRVGLSPLSQARLAAIDGAIRMLLFSLRAEIELEKSDVKAAKRGCKR